VLKEKQVKKTTARSQASWACGEVALCYLLIVDELGYVPLVDDDWRTGAGVLFEVFRRIPSTARHQQFTAGRVDRGVRVREADQRTLRSVGASTTRSASSEKTATAIASNGTHS